VAAGVDLAVIGVLCVMWIATRGRRGDDDQLDGVQSIADGATPCARVQMHAIATGGICNEEWCQINQ